MASRARGHTDTLTSVLFHVVCIFGTASCACVYPPVIDEAPTPGTVPSPGVWTYLRVPLGLNATNAYEYVENHTSNLVVVDWTREREVMCLGLFPGNKPPASPAITDSQPVCVLSHDGHGQDEHAVYYSEYNRKRHVPNLIAYKIPGGAVPNHTHVNRDWGPALKGLDLAYGPMPLTVKSSGWCDNHTLIGDCNTAINTRGHLATMSAFQPSYQDMFATCVYLNTFPSREPFDGAQWNRYENQNIERAKSAGEGLFVIAGPMSQEAGTIPAEDEESESIVVPVWVWSAYADLTACSTVGHICSDGGPDDQCACQDNLDGEALTKYIGFDAFPGLCESTPRAVVSEAVPGRASKAPPVWI